MTECFLKYNFLTPGDGVRGLRIAPNYVIHEAVSTNVQLDQQYKSMLVLCGIKTKKD